MPLDDVADECVAVFEKGGVYYARLRPSSAGELMEIALHGIISEEQARAAVQALTPSSDEAVS